MPLVFGPNYVEGKVYRSRRKQDDDDEKQALRELQTILAVKNRRPCDCEAQIHNLLENCLNCGRLACDLEGSGKCFSCGNIVLSQDQRDRLKNYIDILLPAQISNNTSSNEGGHTFGAGTRIIDNQFDHFAIDNKRHLRDEDKRKMKDDLEELQSRRYQRKLILNVDVENLEAGSKAMPKVDDYEAELRRLQLNYQPIENNSEFSLGQLVNKEWQKSYTFNYVELVESKKKKVPFSEGVLVRIGDTPQQQKKNHASQSKPKNKSSNKNLSKASAWNKNNDKDNNKDKK